MGLRTLEFLRDGLGGYSSIPSDIQRVEYAIPHISDDEYKVLLYFFAIGILAGLPFGHAAYCGNEKFIDLGIFERDVSLDISNHAPFIDAKADGSQIVTFKSAIRNFINGIGFQVL